MAKLISSISTSLVIASALSVAACTSEPEGTVDTDSMAPNVAEEDIDLRHGFSVPSSLGPVRNISVEIPDTPFRSFTFAFPADTDAQELASELRGQFEALDYVEVDAGEAGIAARGPDGRELGLMLIEAGGERSVTLVLTEPR